MKEGVVLGIWMICTRFEVFTRFAFLYENEAPGLEQAAVVTMATRVLRPLKRAFLCIPPERLTACKI